jgi:hypothetical protein
MLGGGLFRLLPEVLKLFTAKQDAAHEFRMTELQLKIDQARATQNLDLVHAQGAIAADTAEMSAMIEALKAQATPTGIKWVDALSSSVRPVLTYWHCLIIYTAYKVALFSIALHGGVTWQQAVVQGYTEFDQSIVSAMLAFWFVDRSLRKTGKP